MVDQKIIDTFIDDVENQYKTTSAGEDGFAVEFMKIKQVSAGLKQKAQYFSTVGEKAENKKKNRYKDILPFDATRVKLLDDNTSDYINASFIKGPNKQASYLASQGPLPHTVDDFWRMLWLYKVKVVIMVCKEEEQGKHKCERYWSKSLEETKSFGNITVTLDKEINHAERFYERVLKAKKFNETRTVHQYHYIGWPDHGVPRTREDILEVVEKARSRQDYSADVDRPVCVHCSAGCGRTGVVLAIDYFRNLLLSQKLTSDARVFNVVIEMRKQRPAIVQTKDQYEFVHLAVADMFTKYMKKQGISLASKLSRSLVDTTYENVTLQTEQPAPAKTHDAFHQKPATLSYENVEPHLETSKHVTPPHPEERPNPPPKAKRTTPRPNSVVVAESLLPRSGGNSPVKLADPPGPTKKSQLYPNADQSHNMHAGPKTKAASPLVNKPKPKVITANPRYDAASSNTATSSDEPTGGESIRARTERLFSKGFASNSGLQKNTELSNSLLELRSGGKASGLVSKPKMLRASSMENNESNKGVFDEVTGRKALMPTHSKPPLPKKAHSIRATRSNGPESAPRKPELANKPNLKSEISDDSSLPTSGTWNDTYVENNIDVRNDIDYAQISATETSRDPDYDMLRHSVKAKGDKKAASAQDVTYNQTSWSTPDFAEVVSTSGRKKAAKRIHVYTEVADFSRKQDGNEISSHPKPFVPLKPNRPSKSRPQSDESEDTTADAYSLADGGYSNKDLYSQLSHPPSGSVYCVVGSENDKSLSVYTFSNDVSKEDEYSLADQHNNIAPCSSASGPGRSASTPPIPMRTPESQLLVHIPAVIPERTPESQVLIPIKSETQEKTAESRNGLPAERVVVSSAYEDVVFDPSTERRPSGAPGLKAASEGNKAQQFFGKTKNVFKAGLQQLGGGGNKTADDSQHARGGKSATHEPTMINNQDIGFKNRPKRKPKGGRPQPQNWFRK